MKVANIEIAFVPYFGNPDHINILDMVGEIESLYKKLKEKEANAKSVVALRNNIEEKVSVLQRQLEFVKQKNGTETNVR